MKIVVRNHKKDNLVTNIRQNYASVLVLSFLWNLGNSNTLRFGQCVMCLMLLNSRSSLKKSCGAKIDEKVISECRSSHRNLLIKSVFF